VQELICGRPTQDDSGRLRGVDARRHTRQIVSPKRAIGGIRPEHRHVGHLIAKLKAAYAITQLIDLSDDIIAQHERWPLAHRLRVEVAADRNVCILQARGEHADSYLSPACRWHWSVDDLQPLRPAEAAHLNNPITRLAHARTPRQENLRGCPATIWMREVLSLTIVKASNTALLMQNFPRAGAVYGPELD